MLFILFMIKFKKTIKITPPLVLVQLLDIFPKIHSLIVLQKAHTSISNDFSSRNRFMVGTDSLNHNVLFPWIARYATKSYIIIQTLRISLLSLTSLELFGNQYILLWNIDTWTCSHFHFRTVSKNWVAIVESSCSYSFEFKIVYRIFSWRILEYSSVLMWPNSPSLTLW